VTDPRTRRRLERDNNRPLTPPPPLPPPAVAIDTTPPSFTCDNCGKVILSTADHIIIRPCTHTLCTFCAFDSHVQRGIAHHTCPVTVCNRPSVSFDYVHGGNDSENLTKTVRENDDYIKNVFPLEWLKTHHKEELTAGHTATAITFTRVCRKEDGVLRVVAQTSTFVTKPKNKKNRPVSSVEVNDFMLQRAKDYPLCAFALLELRIGTVMKLMRNSERLGIRGCVDTFLTAIRLILPLFAVTHKTDYVYLCQDLLKWYYCASDAQKIVYEQFIFTQLTAWGNAIFHDYHVELNVMNIREYCGKTHYAGIDLDMEVVAATLPNSNSVNNQTRTLLVVAV